jgi:hypothetical protein
MLAIWEQSVSLAELRSNRLLVQKFIGRVRKANYEMGGYAMSLDMPMQDGRSWYDVLPVLCSKRHHAKFGRRIRQPHFRECASRHSCITPGRFDRGGWAAVGWSACKSYSAPAPYLRRSASSGVA